MENFKILSAITLINISGMTYANDYIYTISSELFVENVTPNEVAKPVYLRFYMIDGQYVDYNLQRPTPKSQQVHLNTKDTEIKGIDLLDKNLNDVAGSIFTENCFNEYITQGNTINLNTNNPEIKYDPNNNSWNIGFECQIN